MTPTLHMSVEKLTGSKETTSGAMNSGVPCSTFTGVPGAAERRQEASWDYPGTGVQLGLPWDKCPGQRTAQGDESLCPGGAATL